MVFSSQFNRSAHRRTASIRRRRLRSETLETRRLLAIGDVCFPLEPSAAESAPSGIEEGPEQAGEIIVSVADASLVEGHAGRDTLTFSVTLSEAITDPVTVDVSTSDGTAEAFGFRSFASGLSVPIFVTAPDGDTDRLFVLEKGGEIEILQLPGGTQNEDPFLSIPGLITTGERGLLGLAFHPDYAENGKLYVYVSVPGGDNHLSEVREYTVSADPNIADDQSGRTILRISQPYSNHNGGWMDFGPDGYLYIATGDGGLFNDPEERSQDITETLLGKLLRIDVDGDDFPGDANRNYAIPPTNPFVGITGDDEIWAYGLRNPWRNSFDRDTDDLYIADVGQGAREEINVQPFSSVGGENYGWRLREGMIATPGVGGAKPVGAIDPIYDYLHGDNALQGDSVTGGYVYRGPIEELHGHYFFADYTNSRVWSMRFNRDDPSQHDGTNYSDFIDWTPLLNEEGGNFFAITSFGEDAAGNLYIVDGFGEIYLFDGGADYQAASATLTFLPTALTQEFEVNVLGDRLFEADETFQVNLSNPTGAILGVASATGTITNDDAAPPTVESIVINDGGPSRSEITSVSVTFDREVNLSALALELTNLDLGVQLSNYQVSTSVQNNRTVAVLTFAPGTSVVTRQGTGELGNSLANGNYQLLIRSTEVSSVSDGLIMASKVRFGADQADGFFRRFGDLTGDGSVNLVDFSGFRNAYLSEPGDADFESTFDAEGNGLIDLRDFADFRANYG